MLTKFIGNAYYFLNAVFIILQHVLGISLYVCSITTVYENINSAFEI